MPWSDVRRIPRVRVGGLSIHITESLSSSKGRKNSTAATSIGNNSSSSSSTKGISNGTDENEREQSPMPSSSTSLQQQQQSLQHFDRKDSWEHLGRRASLRSFSAGSDVSGGGTDGYELERVAQATLEHALGHEFAAKYQVKGRSTRFSMSSAVWPSVCVRDLEMRFSLLAVVAVAKNWTKCALFILDLLPLRAQNACGSRTLQ